MMPLRDPSRIKDPVRRMRVQVLNETVQLWRSDHVDKKAHAAANLRRWSENPQRPEPTEMRVAVVGGDTLDVTLACTRMFGRMFACINMANSVNPGGGYRIGCAAQEENIARRTQLHFRFNSHVVESNGRYTQDMQNLINGVDGEVHLSEQPLICMRGGEKSHESDLGYEHLENDDIFPFLELRSAAVDVAKERRVDAKHVQSLMTSRIGAQLKTLRQRGIRHVVLSAFGCGAFGNDPTMVAEIYRRALWQHRADFSVVVFAIYHAGHGKDNFRIFHEILKRAKEGAARASV